MASVRDEVNFVKGSFCEKGYMERAIGTWELRRKAVLYDRSDGGFIKVSNHSGMRLKLPSERNRYR